MTVSEQSVILTTWYEPWIQKASVGKGPKSESIGIANTAFLPSSWNPWAKLPKVLAASGSDIDHITSSEQRTYFDSHYRAGLPSSPKTWGGFCWMRAIAASRANYRLVAKLHNRMIFLASELGLPVYLGLPSVQNLRTSIVYCGFQVSWIDTKMKRNSSEWLIEVRTVLSYAL